MTTHIQPSPTDGICADDIGWLLRLNKSDKSDLEPVELPPGFVRCNPPAHLQPPPNVTPVDNEEKHYLTDDFAKKLFAKVAEYHGPPAFDPQHSCTHGSLTESEWTCPKCGTKNTREACKHCGWLRERPVKVRIAGADTPDDAPTPSTPTAELLLWSLLGLLTVTACVVVRYFAH